VHFVGLFFVFRRVSFLITYQRTSTLHCIFIVHKTVQLISPRLLFSGTMSYLYHYTSDKGLRGIQREGVIRSSADTTRDAVLGRGVYLTSLPPSTKDKALLKNNWDGSRKFSSTKQNNLDYCVRFKTKDLPCAQKSGGSRDVWMVPHDIDLKEVPFRVYERQ